MMQRALVGRMLSNFAVLKDFKLPKANPSLTITI
jgi:hypothetical protein